MTDPVRIPSVDRVSHAVRWRDSKPSSWGGRKRMRPGVFAFMDQWDFVFRYRAGRLPGDKDWGDPLPDDLNDASE